MQESVFMDGVDEAAFESYSAGMSLVERRTRFTSADVEAMLEAGLLRNRRVELIDGDLIEMNPLGPVHANLAAWIHDLIIAAYGRGYHVRDHSPVDLGPLNQPEPDIALVRAPLRRTAPHPVGAHLALVVEIAYSSLEIDRAKASVYARGGGCEYWIVDVVGRSLEVFKDAGENGYRNHQVLSDEGRVGWPEIGGQLDVSELLP